MSIMKFTSGHEVEVIELIESVGTGPVEDLVLSGSVATYAFNSSYEQGSGYTNLAGYSDLDLERVPAGTQPGSVWFNQTPGSSAFNGENEAISGISGTTGVGDTFIYRSVSALPSAAFESALYFEILHYETSSNSGYNGYLDAPLIDLADHTNTSDRKGVRMYASSNHAFGTTRRMRFLAGNGTGYLPYYTISVLPYGEWSIWQAYLSGGTLTSKMWYGDAAVDVIPQVYNAFNLLAWATPIGQHIGIGGWVNAGGKNYGDAVDNYGGIQYVNIVTGAENLGITGGGADEWIVNRYTTLRSALSAAGLGGFQGLTSGGILYMKEFIED